MCALLHSIAYIDLNIFFHNCFLGDSYKQEFDKHFSYDLANGTIVGFSSLKYTPEEWRTRSSLAATVYRSAKRYKTMEEAQQSRQHDVIFDTAEQKYYIDVIYNQTVAKEKAGVRSEYEASSSPPLVENVLLIFLDSVSRF